MTDQDQLIEQLAALDPARVDRPPAPGSPRLDMILERAMQNPSAVLNPRVRARPRRRTFLGVSAAAAIIVATVVAAAVLFEPGATISSAGALTQAAEHTADALTLRSEYIQDAGHGRFNVVRSEHRGADLRRTFSVIENGIERREGEDDEYVVFIGDKGWKPGDGANDATTVRPDERNAPYAESSAAIVKAAVTDSNVDKIGTENVRGADATHYRIRIDGDLVRRLDKLPANQLSGFELEDAGHIRSLDVWVEGDYIRQIRVTQTWQPRDSKGTTVEFYDFGADITITPPG